MLVSSFAIVSFRFVFTQNSCNSIMQCFNVIKFIIISLYILISSSNFRLNQDEDEELETMTMLPLEMFERQSV